MLGSTPSLLACTADASSFPESPAATRDTGGGAGSSGATAGAGGNSSASTPSGTSGVGAGGTSAGASTSGGASADNGAGAGGVPGGGGEDPTCSQGVWDGSTVPTPLTLTGNTFAHDPTMLEADGVFYRFWTGDDIPMATSTDLTHWQNGPSVYASGYPAWVDEWLQDVTGETFNFPWAPDVSRWNGLYHLYSSFSAKFGDNISCITHLTTTDIAAAAWTDHGPVLCTEGSESYNAIDADLGLTQDGTPWLAFGSFWDGIMLVELDSEGRPADGEMKPIAWAAQIEAPVLFYRCGYYYLFVSWGLCCPGEGRPVDQLSYRIAVGRSASISGPYLDKNGVDMAEGGGTALVQGDGVNWAAAGHGDVVASGDKIYHLYHAYRQSDGGAQLRIVEMPFDEQGWPVAGGP